MTDWRQHGTPEELARNLEWYFPLDEHFRELVYAAAACLRELGQRDLYSNGHHCGVCGRDAVQILDRVATCLWCNHRPETAPQAQHKWDRDGERCVKCGAKDWMDDPVCSVPQAQQSNAKPYYTSGAAIWMNGANFRYSPDPRNESGNDWPCFNCRMRGSRWYRESEHIKCQTPGGEIKVCPTAPPPEELNAKFPDEEPQAQQSVEITEEMKASPQPRELRPEEARVIEAAVDWDSAKDALDHGVPVHTLLRRSEGALLKAVSDLHTADDGRWRGADDVPQATCGWRDIESAPRDGTDVLVYCSDTGEQMVAFWNGTMWQFARFHPAEINIVCRPSRWMPLPAPASLEEPGE